MARLTHGPITPRSLSNPDSSLTDLNRLLARLQQSILQADAERERRLRTSEYERNKVGINLEYARSLLTKLEQDALGVKVHTRRQEMQADLNQKRDVFDQLTERLRELEEISIDSDEDSSDGEDLLADIIATPSQSSDSRSGEGGSRRGGMGDVEQDEDRDEYEDEEGESTVLPDPRRSETAFTASGEPARQQDAIPSQPGPQAAAGGAGTSTSQIMRARSGAPSDPATTTQGETTALRSHLFGSRPSDPTTALTTSEAIMDHHRAEQDKLTESMVGMARALKESTFRFSSSLQEDEEVLKAAGSGLDKNERGLDAASRRMGALRKLTEGEGWWGRMLLYAWIFGLAVVAVLVVFVLPKLRF